MGHFAGKFVRKGYNFILAYFSSNIYIIISRNVNYTHEPEPAIIDNSYTL